MVVQVKPIVGIVPGLQSVALVGRAYRMVPRKYSRSSFGPKKFVRGFVDLSVGTGLTKATSDMVGKL